MEKTKSFRYSPEEHPKVERWIQTLEKAGVNFSAAIRRLIEDSEVEKGEIKKEIESLRRQVESLRDTGRRPGQHRPDIPEEAATGENETEREPAVAAVDPGFIRNRYFS